MVKTLAARLPAIIVALALALGLAGCSAVRLGYSTLPDLAWWWLDGYFDFDDAQGTQVRSELARLHGWHRERELPVLAGLLARIEQAAPQSVPASQVCAWTAEVRTRLEQVALQAQPAAAAIALTLRPHQLAHLQRKYERNNADFRREWIDVPPADRIDRRLKQLLDRAEMFYGPLDTRQRALLRDALERSGYDPLRLLAERQRRQQDLLATVREMQRRPAEAQRLLHGFVQRVLRSPDPAFRAAQDAWLQENCAWLAALHETTTPGQRQRAVRRLQEYQRDLQELARPPAALPAGGPHAN